LYRHQVYLREKLTAADGIVTCCEFNRTYMIDRYGAEVPELAARIHVCYHGLDLAHFRYQPDGRPPARIVAVGRLAKHKGFDYLLRAIRLLRDRGRAVELVLVGDGGEQKNLSALATELGIADAVRFAGWLKFTDVQKAMSDATMLVHPSPGLGDGLPNVLREAMALGTPVIASRVAGIPEALDDGRCGLLVPPGDVGALADAVTRLLDDAELRQSLARRGRERTEEKFDMWRNGARLADRLRRTNLPVPA
jgi:glycosyltransferase involved in cell wall biosynthesis